MTSPVRITGATRLYAMVGDPVVQTRSPEVYSERFASEGFKAVLVPIQVPVAGFNDVIPALMAIPNLDGMLVTAPFKSRMLPFAKNIGAASACIGAVNALRREPDGSWSGDIFDGAGFVRGIEAKGEALRGRRVLMFGAGGAGSAIAFSLAAAGVTSIRINDPNPGRIEAIATALRIAFPACDVAAATANIPTADLVVNASPVGMKPGDGMPGDIGELTGDVLMADVVVSDVPTAFVQYAIQHGCRWVNGRDMHSGQIEAIMAFFRPSLLANA